MNPLLHTLLFLTGFGIFSCEAMDNTFEGNDFPWEMGAKNPNLTKLEIKGVWYRPTSFLMMVKPKYDFS